MRGKDSDINNIARRNGDNEKGAKEGDDERSVGKIKKEKMK